MYTQKWRRHHTYTGVILIISITAFHVKQMSFLTLTLWYVKLFIDTSVNCHTVSLLFPSVHVTCMWSDVSGLLSVTLHSHLSSSTYSLTSLYALPIVRAYQYVWPTIPPSPSPCPPPWPAAPSSSSSLACDVNTCVYIDKVTRNWHQSDCNNVIY